MVQSFGAAPSVLLGAIVGILTAVAIGWLLARGLLRLDLRLFFAWTGAILVIAASGVLPYAFKDLQEAGVVPGPFTAGAPIDPTTDAVAVGWSAFPLGWAFDLSTTIPPGSTLATVLQAAVGFMPRMSWLQVSAWALYVGVVGTMFVRGLRRRPTRSAAHRPAATASVVAASPRPTVALNAVTQKE